MAFLFLFQAATSNTWMFLPNNHPIDAGHRSVYYVLSPLATRTLNWGSPTLIASLSGG